MTYETFDLFVNELKPDADAEQVKSSLAGHFNTSPEKLDAFFRRLLNSKEPEKIQKGLSLEMAQKNKKIIEDLGLLCDIIPSLTLTAMMQEEEDEKARYQCPACGHKQTLSVNNPDICEACGIVGNKYLDKESDKSILKQEVKRYNRLKKLSEKHLQEQTEISNREKKILEIRKNLEKKDRKSVSHPFALGAMVITACGIWALQFYNEHAIVVSDITEEKSTSIQASVDVGTKAQTVVKMDQLQQVLPSIDGYPSSNQEFLTSAKALSATGADAFDTNSSGSLMEQNASTIPNWTSQMEVNHDIADRITSRQTSVDVGLENPAAPIMSRSELTQDQAVVQIDQLQQALPSTDGYLSSNQDFVTSVKALNITTGADPDIAPIELSQVTADTQLQLSQSMKSIADTNSSGSSMEQNASTVRNLASQIQVSHDKDALLLERLAINIQNNEVDQSEDIAESIDNPYKRTLALINISHAKLTLGDSAGAESVLNKAVQVADAITSPIEQIKSYGSIATAFSELKDSSSAQRVFDTALVYANRLADPVDRVSSLIIVGGYQAASGNKEAARKSFKLAQSFAAKNIVDPEVRNMAYQVIALNRATTADFQEALRTADRITQPLMRAGIIKKLADIQSYLGQQDDAKRTYSLALENSVHISDVLQRRRMLDNIIAALENVDGQTSPSATGR